MVIKVETTQRSLYYYELNFSPFKRFEGVEHYYLQCFKHANIWVKDKDKLRYLIRGNDTLFFGQLDYVPDKKYIKGRLFKVRNDILPQIINLSNEDITDLDIEEGQGLLETTHFLIDYRKRAKAVVTLEYNHNGARISEFVKYLSYLGRKTSTVKRVDPVPLVRDRLESITTRLNRVSSFMVKVHKDNIDRIQNTDSELASALYHAQNYSNSDYVFLKLKTDYKIKTNTNKVRESINNWVRKFVSTPDEAEIFDTFRVEGEDEEKNNSLEVFDLITDKERSKITVEKKPNSRIVVSNNFFPKIIKEYERKFL